jgi:hypothetical protein
MLEIHAALNRKKNSIKLIPIGDMDEDEKLATWRREGEKLFFFLLENIPAATYSELYKLMKNEQEG